MKDRFEQYEREAQAAEEAARQATDETQKRAFLEVAQGWRRLARPGRVPNLPKEPPAPKDPDSEP